MVTEVRAVGDIEGDHEGVEIGAELGSAEGGLRRAGLYPEVRGGSDGLTFENCDRAFGKNANNDEDDEEGDEETTLVSVVVVIANPPELGVGEQTKLYNHLLIKVLKTYFLKKIATSTLTFHISPFDGKTCQEGGDNKIPFLGNVFK